MENNTEEKKRFFATHYGQEFQISNSSGEINWMLLKHWNGYKDKCWIPLNSLESITEEHAIEVARIWSGNDELLSAAEIGWKVINGLFNWGQVNAQLKATGLIVEHIVSFLRKNSYAVPFDGKSVEELITLGWVKIKQQ